MPQRSNGTNAKRVNLALQGGGAHGAFTWGVLDALIADGRLEFEGISGASAGAMNAVAVAQGWLDGGRDGAREALERFWGRVAAHQALMPLRNAPWEQAIWGHDLTYSLAYQGFENFVRTFSPYQFNPLDWNPLRQVIQETMDFDRLRAASPHKLFISATDVATGKARVFTERELSVEVLTASACLPFLFQAPTIDGKRYWDGGYSGNPPLWPLFETCTPEDIILVEINPINRAELPTSAPDILNRLNEIGMTTALRGEMRAIAFVQRLRDEGRVDAARYRRLHVHAIHDEEAMVAYNVSTKFNADLGFLRELKALGEAAARGWLADHFVDVGVRDSVDIRARYL